MTTTTTTTTGEGERLAAGFGALADMLASATDMVTPHAIPGERTALASHLASDESMRAALAHIAAVSHDADALITLNDGERRAILAAWHAIQTLADAIRRIQDARTGRG